MPLPHAFVDRLSARLAALRARDGLRTLESFARAAHDCEWRSTRETAAEETADSETTAGGSLNLTPWIGNDYLGLATHPEIAAAMREALAGAVVGAGASRLLSGTTPEHVALERDIARWRGTESALVFASGYQLATGVIPALAGSGDLIVCDAHNHASLIDGCRLSRARRVIVPHGDPGAVDAALAATPPEPSGLRFILTDSLFSMDGTLADLPALVEIANRREAVLVIDDAHAGGVLGASGRGALEHFGLAPDNAIQLGTLSKAVGVAGGFVAASAPVIDWLVNTARSFIYSTAPPPVVMAGASAALSVLAREGAARRAHLLALGARFEAGAATRELPVPRTPTPIKPLIVGEPGPTLALALALRRRGQLVKAIRPPTVAVGTARLRLTLSAARTTAELDALLDALADACRAPGIRSTRAGSPSG